MLQVLDHELQGATVLQVAHALSSIHGYDRILGKRSFALRHSSDLSFSHQQITFACYGVLNVANTQHVSHEMLSFIALCAVMDEGRVVEAGTPAELCSDPLAFPRFAALYAEAERYD